MSNSSRRVVRTTAALVGMAAIGAVGTGTAFADTGATPDRAPEGVGHTDHTAAQDGLASTRTAAVEPHAFQMPGAHHHARSLAVTKKRNNNDNDHKRSHSGKRDNDHKRDHSNTRTGKHRKH